MSLLKDIRDRAIFGVDEHLGLLVSEGSGIGTSTKRWDCDDSFSLTKEVWTIQKREF